jgi:hypothetical protein
MLWRAPLELVGLGSERQVLRLPLFLGYRELRDAPFATFRATLQACSPALGCVLRCLLRPASGGLCERACEDNFATHCQGAAQTHTQHCCLMRLGSIESRPEKRFIGNSDMRLLHGRVLTAGQHAVQPRARGGEVPRLFNAKAHVHLRLGALRRLFYWVPPCCCLHRRRMPCPAVCV